MWIRDSHQDPFADVRLEIRPAYRAAGRRDRLVGQREIDIIRQTLHIKTNRVVAIRGGVRNDGIAAPVGFHPDLVADRHIAGAGRRHQGGRLAKGLAEGDAVFVGNHAPLRHS